MHIIPGFHNAQKIAMSPTGYRGYPYPIFYIRENESTIFPDPGGINPSSSRSSCMHSPFAVKNSLSPSGMMEGFSSRCVVSLPLCYYSELKGQEHLV
jgi:hypothetical protein